LIVVVFNVTELVLSVPERLLVPTPTYVPREESKYRNSTRARFTLSVRRATSATCPASAAPFVSERKVAVGGTVSGAAAPACIKLKDCPATMIVPERGAASQLPSRV